MKKCANCGSEVGVKQHFKVTYMLVQMKKIPKKVYCSVPCALADMENESDE